MTESTSTVQRKLVPTIHVVSDSTGVTAQALARAAAAQFGVNEPKIRLLSGVKDFEAIRSFLDKRREQYMERYHNDQVLVFYTLVSAHLHEAFKRYLEEHPSVIAVDLMTGAIEAIEKASGLEPLHEPGSLRATGEDYFRRIEAVEFTIAHDDGRNPQDLRQADIVLIGVSRTSKTPLSIYLSQQGYKVGDRHETVADVAQLPDHIGGKHTAPQRRTNIKQPVRPKSLPPEQILHCPFPIIVPPHNGGKSKGRQTYGEEYRPEIA